MCVCQRQGHMVYIWWEGKEESKRARGVEKRNEV